MRKTNTRLLTTIAIRIAVNCLGAFITVSTKVPLLLDHIGSLLVCMLFGRKCGIMTVFLSSIVNQILFDPFTLPFAPTGMLMVSMVGTLCERGYFRKLHTIPTLLLAVFSGTTLDAVIQGYIFDGVTGSGNDVIIGFMINKGIGPAAASFTNQYFMEFVDRLISFTVVIAAIERIKIGSMR